MTQEIVFIVTSLSKEPVDESRLAELVRRHWSIENQLHYRRDWTFDEDRCRTIAAITLPWNSA